jgi:hypothetical protein
MWEWSWHLNSSECLRVQAILLRKPKNKENCCPVPASRPNAVINNQKTRKKLHWIMILNASCVLLFASLDSLPILQGKAGVEVSGIENCAIQSRISSWSRGLTINRDQQIWIKCQTILEQNWFLLHWMQDQHRVLCLMFSIFLSRCSSKWTRSKAHFGRIVNNLNVKLPQASGLLAARVFETRSLS